MYYYYLQLDLKHNLSYSLYKQLRFGLPYHKRFNCVSSENRFRVPDKWHNSLIFRRENLKICIVFQFERLSKLLLNKISCI